MTFSARDRRPRNSGTVLIITLAALAVMTVLLLALLHGVSHQMRGAQGDAASAREKLLADSAVQLVIGQIEQASAQTNQTWISQPGLLRTYDKTASRIPDGLLQTLFHRERGWHDRYERQPEFFQQ